MRVLRTLALYDKKDLTKVLERSMDHDQAMSVIRTLRKLKMPSDFYALLFEALISKNPETYYEKLKVYDQLIDHRLEVLCQEKKTKRS